METGINVKEEKGTIRSLLTSDQMKGQFSTLLQSRIKPDKFVQVALTAFNKTPKLADCTKQSVVACLLDLAQIGLEPDGRNAHLIPYGNKCTVIYDYKGLVTLARRAGDVADIHADVVCENDEFTYSYGSDGTLVHKPNIRSRGNVIAAYSFIKMKDGTSSYEVMSVEEIEAVRKRSKSKDAGPWVTDWKEMAKKTAFKRHSKWLNLSPEFQKAVESDFDAPADFIDMGTYRENVPMPEAVQHDEVPPADDQQVKAMLKFAKDNKVSDAEMLDLMQEAGVSDNNNINRVEYAKTMELLMDKVAKKNGK